MSTAEKRYFVSVEEYLAGELRSPIKHEYFEGGDVWVEGATANPDDEQARHEAERVACA